VRIALVVGHKSRSTGARNTTHDISEWEYNYRVAIDVWRRLIDAGYGVDVVLRRTWGKLPGDINSLEPDLVIALHCNSFPEPPNSDWEASGTETLYYHRSEDSKAIAAVVQNEFVKSLKLPDRGIKPITQEDRGGSLLAKTHAPAVICEPLFIDNDSDLRVTRNGVDISLGYYAAVVEAVKQLA